MSHHLDDATLVAYSAGTLPGALRFVSECHLELCPHCRAALRAANEIGGAMLSEMPFEEVSAGARDSVMSRIGSATVHRLPLIQPTQQRDMPRALQQMLHVESLGDIHWRKSAPGVHTCKLPKDEGEAGFFGLLRIAPGAVMPEHGHGGTELTLILKGAYHDELGHFGVGDIADHDESVEHKPVVVGDEACICLVATEAATRFRSWPARIMQRFIGI